MKSKELEQGEKLKCEECGKEIHLGEDLIVVEKCVIGPSRIVPLGAIFCFCCEKCLCDYFSVDGLKELGFRIP